MLSGQLSEKVGQMYLREAKDLEGLFQLTCEMLVKAAV